MPLRAALRYPKLSKCSSPRNLAPETLSTQVGLSVLSLSPAARGAIAPFSSTPHTPTNPPSPTRPSSPSNSPRATRTRALSSLPGPLESRKRTGKRHMADIYSVHYTPPVADVRPVDLIKWTWRAPTAKRAQATGIAEVFEKVARGCWEALERLRVVERPVDWANTVDKPVGADPLLVTLEGIEDLAYGAEGMSTELYRAVQRYNVEFSRAVELGLCREDEIVGFAKRLFGALGPLKGTEEAADILLSGCLEQLCDGMRKSSVGKAVDYSEQVWRCFYELAMEVDMSVTGMRAIWNVMGLMPASYISGFHTEVPKLLDSILAAWKDTLAMLTKEELAFDILPFQPLTRRAAEILGRFPMDVLSGYLTMFFSTAFAAVHVKQQYHLKLAFASVVAHVPNARQATLVETLSTLFVGRNQRTYVPDLQLCNMLLHQWYSRGYIEKPNAAYMSFYGSANANSKRLALANMVSTIAQYLPTKRHVPTMMSLCEFLRRQHRLFDLVRSYDALFRTTSIRVKPKSIAAIASACSNVKVATSLYKLAKLHPRHIEGGARALDHVWSWKMWAKYVPDLIRQPTFTGTELLTLLELRNDKVLGRTASPEYASFIQTTLITIAKERRFTVRQRLHYFDRGVAFLRSRNMHIRKPLVVAIAALVLRDLRLGHLGRSMRIVWLRDLVFRHLGMEALQKIDAYIQRSRFLNQMSIRSKIGRSPGRERAVMGFQATWQMRKKWRRVVFRRRRRVAVMFAREVWGRRAGLTEAWVLMKNHIRWMRARLRDGRFREWRRRGERRVVDRRWVVKRVGFEREREREREREGHVIQARDVVMSRNTARR